MVRIHREPPMEGPPARGSGLYPLRRQISAARQVRLLRPLPDFCAGSSTDENSWPTPNRCGFNSGTAHQGRISSKVEPAIDNREVGSIPTSCTNLCLLAEMADALAS